MRKRLYYIICTCASVMLTFCGCTDDPADGTEQVRQQELRISLGSHQFDITRASGDLPNDFVPYSHGDRTISQIQCYMTYEKSGDQEYIPCVFNHVEDASAPLGHVWTSKVPLYTLTNGTYYLYGFMPKESVGSGVTIEPYNNGTTKTFTNGVVMTLTGLNAVSPDDICVIVGAKGYDGTPANIPDMSYRLGKFDYYPDENGNSLNSLYLLVDHLYAGLKFNMKLDTNYGKLRGIKVKSVKLIPEDGNNEVIETVDAVVTIVANEDNNNPIVPIYNPAGSNIGGSVEYPTDRFKKGKAPKPAVIYEGEGKELSAENQEFLACLCPSTNKHFILETKYDVYDRKKNLIREGETARNSITLERDLTSGQTHTVNITVKPTFLYMLSDPDLDSPTFETSSE